jgi:hypothetical protein
VVVAFGLVDFWLGWFAAFWWEKLFWEMLGYDLQCVAQLGKIFISGFTRHTKRGK